MGEQLGGKSDRCIFGIELVDRLPVITFHKLFFQLLGFASIVGDSQLSGYLAQFG